MQFPASNRGEAIRGGAREAAREKASKNSNTKRPPPRGRQRGLRAQQVKNLPDGGKAPGQGGRLPGFHKRRRTEVDVDVREYADGRDQCRAQKADDHDLQMSAPIGAVHRMIHGVLRSFRAKEKVGSHSQGELSNSNN
jgi:hypothetical protein